MEKPPPEVERIGEGTRQIAQIMAGQLADAARSGLRDWSEAFYSTKLNEELTGIVHALWVKHPDGQTTPIPPAGGIMRFVNLIYGVSGKLEKPFIGFSITMKPDGACETDFLYP